MNTENSFDLLVQYTEKMHESAKNGDWDNVRSLDSERIKVLKYGVEHNTLTTHKSGLSNIQQLHDRIIDLARAERNIMTREFREQSDRLQHCQAYLKTDRHSEFKS